MSGHRINSQRQLGDLRKSAEDFRVVMIQSGAINHVSQDQYMDQLRALERALNTLNYIIGHESEGSSITPTAAEDAA